MPATATPDRHPSHIDITPAEFERRLAAHGHGADEIHHLWEELARSEPEPAEGRVLGLGPVIAVYLGLLLVVAACVSLVALYWDELGSWGVLGVSSLYLAGYLVASEILRRREILLPAEVLQAVAVAWVCLATYAVEELTGLWPENMDDVNGMPRSYTVITIAGLAATSLLFAARPDPLMIIPAAIGTTALALDVAELVFGGALDDISPRQGWMFAIPVGVAWIAVGLWLDATRRRAYATWAHWCGLAIAGIGLLVVIPKTVPGFTMVGILGAISLFFSAFVRHWSFTVAGAAGVLVATTASFGEFGRVAPLAAALVGLVLIYVGLRWSRWREAVRRTVLAHMPVRARRLVERLAP